MSAHMTPDELPPILAAYRKQVEPAWSAATAHRRQGAPGDPAGQCGVTSAWLQERLKEDHDLDTLYCVGDVHQGFLKSLRDHCWLETNGRLVIDLTVDQAWPDAPYAGWYWGLRKQSKLDYQALRWLTPEALADDPVQTRVQVLRLELDTQARTEWVRSHRVEGG